MENTVLGNTIEVNNILTNNANLFTQTITDAQNEVAAVSNMNNVNASVQSGQLALGMAAGQGIAQAVSTDFSGALNTAASNFQYAFNQTTSMQANTANLGIAITTRKEITSAMKQSNSVRNAEGNHLNLLNTRRKQRAERTNLNTETTSQTTQNNRSAAVNKANMQRGYNTNVANAGRSRSTALSAIENGIKQAALGAPLEGGASPTPLPRPRAPWMGLRGADPGHRFDYGSGVPFRAIRLRFRAVLGFHQLAGHARFHLLAMRRCMDNPPRVHPGAASLIRSILIEGTTVWREPAIIGATDIWEN